MKRRILFVDDEPKVLRGLQRTLYDLANEWEMAFAGNGREALALLAKEPFDVVVSDMRMPEMNGAQLLREVMNKQPQTVRIVLSGHSDTESILQSIGVTHQYLAKPCDVNQLRDVVGRACTMRELLASDVMRQLVCGIECLPSLPRLYMEMLEEMQKPQGSVKRVAEIISKDVGMTAKVLQIVNSAFFGLSRHVSGPAEAVTLLGFENVRALVLVAHVFRQLDGAALAGLCLESLWSHSLRVSALAKGIASAENADSRTCDYAGIGGLLHDAGRLVLASSQRRRYRWVLRLVRGRMMSLAEAEEKLFGCTHAEVGAYLFGLWGLPDPVVEAIALHHCPRQCVAAGFTPLTAVHVADAIQHEQEDPDKQNPAAGVDFGYLDQLGLTDRLPIWTELDQVQSHEGVHS